MQPRSHEDHLSPQVRADHDRRAAPHRRHERAVVDCRERAEADADRVSQTYAVKQALESTIRHLIDVENGARGFSLTAEDRLLDPIMAGRQILPQDIASLRQLTADNPTQQRHLDVLEPQIDSALRFAEALVASRRSTGAILTLVSCARTTA
jgi:CHASE3 domain sensor protein